MAPVLASRAYTELHAVTNCIGLDQKSDWTVEQKQHVDQEQRQHIDVEALNMM